MARAYRGPYARQSTYEVPYATAEVWGTGINRVHEIHWEGPPLRVIGRQDALGSSPVAREAPRDPHYQHPHMASEDNPPQERTWGYPIDYSPDSFGQGADAPISHGDTSFATEQYKDDRPSWGNQADYQRLRGTAGRQPSWSKSGALFRAIRGGNARFRLYDMGIPPHGADAYEPISAEPSNSNPTETVSEGWENKVTSYVAHAHPSDPSQYEIQTSMRQRFLTQDNGRAVLRGTDAIRSPIPSRVEAMVEKRYSEGERLYDMYPFQSEQMNRPFRFRTAGTGPSEWMETNEFEPMVPWQRTPPPDPPLGQQEVAESGDYGYTGEDTMYYAG